MPTFIEPIWIEKITPSERRTRHSPGRTSKTPERRVHQA
jgi:hypothetical protein